MDFAGRLRDIDAHLSKPHSVLNRIATGEVVEAAAVHAAIAEITLAREKLNDGAEPAPEN